MGWVVYSIHEDSFQKINHNSCRMKRILQKLSKGSVLVYTIILLFILLTVSIGMMSASVRNLKSVSSGDHSINAFGVADSGSEAVLAKIKRASGSTIDTIADIDCSDPSLAKISSGLFNGSYSVTFLDKDEKTLTCSDKISDVTSIKSVGSYADTARAVEVAVAASTCPATGGVIVAESSSDEKGFDSNKIMSLFKDEKATIVRGTCYSVQGARLVTFSSGTIDFQPAYTDSIYIYSGPFADSPLMTCSSGNKICGMYPTGMNNLPYYTCTGGWRIYAECPAN